MTTGSNAGRMSEVEAQLISRAIQDAAFRDRLIADPKAILAEQGLAVSEDVKIQVLQETSSQYYLVLPAEYSAADSTIALSDTELEAIAGGAASQVTSWTGCGTGQSGCIVSNICNSSPPEGAAGAGGPFVPTR
ncbi:MULTISPECIES: NHLP leader peptide family RiPP precursor [Leptolyngbya]|uniref:NHLP leader peptide family RiPP precursor n=1 Tax=Leptolyngbya TaxID=47251 RepID=UPI00168987F1|nr:NHLP leader peptide family RiPP precursor [Leptolyngbya sp. FACHB-1624]MBD1856124.1 NHLP leader peptide family natural product precursor [Leptolyngbya sp. FACHB-1624]